ncbi:hypothetical protein ACFPFV_12310 [Salinicoccus siamensis]|uniref:hypothetical protein n=1 Tax=Salinicoccus siamensis TaxID=381830 RepID=UPI00361FDBAC
MHTPKITVIGSINMDLVTITENMPKQGETLRAKASRPYRAVKVPTRQLPLPDLVQRYI